MNLTKKEKFSFGFGALGKDAICCFVGNFLMFYFTDVLFLAPAFVGTLFFVARIWDAINDPMMGLVVDNTHNRFGKFRTWLLVGTLLNAVVFLQCLIHSDFMEKHCIFMYQLHIFFME